jgi:hypothetical protein
MGKLNVKALAVALGASWAICVLFVGWASMFGWGTKFVDMMAAVYIGFAPTFLGAVIGAIWAFIDGAIGGAIIAFVYNVVAKKR